MYSQSIRLLRFSMTHDGRFTGRLTVFPLAEAPPFYTVSYTWGKDKESNTTIDLDSIELPVLPNLVPFMRMVSQHPDFSDNQWWWIDSLCINLTDIREREQQVQLMANIYKRSRSVIVWLGNEVEPGSDCTQALDFLLYLSTLPLSPSWSSNPAAREDQNTIRQALRDPRYSAQWNALSNLLSRPWWSRVWTLQEFVLPAKGRICCGTETCRLIIRCTT
ncbi:unnamed protein product [Periconia digitata]|uniref:Heterokaryon incompatibility domain-containing protein n=1 Tax=Periconia digitata TaxID=1303443 RepID=A0A9W4US13_9PLEO|nr:unnamed protein product [Periconia digitata]